jgi:hypothetical protein
MDTAKLPSPSVKPVIYQPLSASTLFSKDIDFCVFFMNFIFKSKLFPKLLTNF